MDVSGMDVELREFIESLRRETPDIEPTVSDLHEAAHAWLCSRTDEQGRFRNPGDKLRSFAAQPARRVEVISLIDQVIGTAVAEELRTTFPQGVVLAEDAESYLLCRGVVVQIEDQLVSRSALERFLSEHSSSVRQSVTQQIAQKRADLARLIENQVEAIASEEHRVVATLEQGAITPEILDGHFLQIGPELIKALRASTHNVLSLARLRADLVNPSPTAVDSSQMGDSSVRPLADDLVLFGADMLTDALPRLTAKNPEIVKKTSELIRTDYKRRYQRLAKSLRESNLKTIEDLDRLIDRMQSRGV
jgi:hypothetical protein